jgi:hypothetical protein
MLFSSTGLSCHTNAAFGAGWYARMACEAVPWRLGLVVLAGSARDRGCYRTAAPHPLS